MQLAKKDKIFLIGAITSILSTLLPWSTITTLDGSFPISGTRLGIGCDSGVLIIVSGLIGGLAVFLKDSWKRKLLSLFSGGFIIYNVVVYIYIYSRVSMEVSDISIFYILAFILH